jgi:hypothetical protein
MPSFGNLILEGFGYKVADADLPEFNMDGTPTGRLLKRKILALQSLGQGTGQPEGPVIELRFAPEDWETFKQQITQKQVQLASAADLAALGRANGTPPL